MSEVPQILASAPASLTWREKLAYLTYRFHELDQAETPVTHIWRDGKYIREMRIPADTLFIGRAHLHGHHCELVEGRAVHILADARIERAAPFATVTTPGYQMVFYTLTPVIGRTAHPDTGERDIENAEAEIFEPLSALLTEGAAIYTRLDREAYSQLLAAHGIDESTYRAPCLATHDLIPFAEPVDVEIGRSAIEGSGVIAKRDFAAGERICDARIGRNRTPAGRYANHSHDHNAEPRLEPERVALVATRRIARGSEITVNYRQMVLAGKALRAP